MTEINKDRVRLLVDALRSGEYPQIQGTLRRVTPEGQRLVGYCCLGVACEVARINGVSVELVSHPVDPTMSIYDGETGIMPRSVMEWFGFPQGNPKVGTNENGELLYATTVNDTFLWDFDMIANAIEKTYLSEE